MTKNPRLVFRLKLEVSKQKFFVFSFMKKKFIVHFHSMGKMLIMQFHIWKKLILLFYFTRLVIKQKYVFHGLNSRHFNFHNNRTTRTNYLAVKICRSGKGKRADPVSFVGLFYHICAQNHLKNGRGIESIFCHSWVVNAIGSRQSIYGINDCTATPVHPVWNSFGFDAESSLKIRILGNWA